MIKQNDKPIEKNYEKPEKTTIRQYDQSMQPIERQYDQPKTPEMRRYK